MTPAFLRRCADAYSSEAPTTCLAEALGVDARSLRRWLVGVHPVPEWGERELPEILRDRAIDLRVQAETCDELADEIDAAIGLEKPLDSDNILLA